MDYGNWTLKKLKEELSKRGARLSGRKVELIERLESYDRNANFGREQVLEEEYIMALPPLELYKDINTDNKIPAVSYQAINFYLEQLKTKVCTKAKHLYNSRFLKYLRISRYNDLFYFKSECKAEMKRRCSYRIDVCIDIDGAIVECQCECASGQGPEAHCKHIRTALYAIHRFTTCGDILTEQTCTQRLQTFHQSKPYNGSPVKACDLHSRDGLDNGMSFDPRPAKYRKTEGYRDHFRSVWLNHPQVESYPVAQLFKPGNTYAVNSDDDYDNKPLADQWLEMNKLSNVSNEDISVIECVTQGQARSNMWREQHAMRLTSSNFKRICCATDRTDRHSLARSLTNPVQEIPAPSLKHGRKYERYAIKKFENLAETITTKCGMFVCKDLPYLAATPDALLGEDHVIEVKCPYSARNRMISEVSVPYLKLVDGKLKLDENKDYYYQIQGQLLCTGRTKCIFIVYTLLDIHWICVPRNEIFIERMVSKLKYFHVNYFKDCVLDKFYFKDYSRYSFQNSLTY